MTAALESFSDKLDAWTTVLLTELLCCFDDDEEHKDKRGECEYTNIERRMPSSIFPLQSRPKKKRAYCIKQKKRTIVIQRVTPSREDQMHVPFGGNLVYGNLLAS